MGMAELIALRKPKSWQLSPMIYHQDVELQHVFCVSLSAFH